MGISEVLFFPEMFLPPAARCIGQAVGQQKRTGYRDLDMLKTAQGVAALVKEYRKSHAQSIQFFSPLIQQLLDQNNMGAVEIKAYQQVYRKLEKVDGRLLFLRILYEGEAFSPWFMRSYLQLALHLQKSRAVMKFWMFVDAAQMVFRYPAYLYDDYYNDRKMLLYEVKKCMDVAVPCFPARVPHTGKKYAILVNGLAGGSNAVSYLVFQYANELVKQGKQVQVFAADVLYYRKKGCFVQPLKAVQSCSATFSCEHKKLLRPEVKVCYTHGADVQGKAQNCLKNIAAYQPDVVVDAAGQGSFLPVFLEGAVPVIHLTFNGYISGAVFDKYISKCRQFTLEENQRFHAMEEDKIEEILIGFRFQPPKKVFQRMDYGFSPDDFIYVTVGNRLDVELQEDFVSVACSYLDRSKRGKWLVVGKTSPRVFQAFRGLLEQKKIVLLAYEKDLTGLYAICNAYLNPNRTGGGTSIYWAMCMGLPVVMTDFRSDILPTVGLGNVVSGGYPKLAEYMERLEQDAGWYRKKQETMRRRAKESNVRQYIASLIKVADQLV